MDKVLTSILAAEDEARTKLDAAKQRAQETRSKADAAAEQLIAEARERAQAAAKAQLEQAKREAEALRVAGLESIRADIDKRFAELNARAPNLAKQAAALVLATELDGGAVS